VTSPDEPGYPGVGDSPNGDGSVEHEGAHHAEARSYGGRVLGGGDVPPWERGGAPSSAQHESRQAHPPGDEAWVPRFMSGTAAPAATSGRPPGHAKPPAVESDAAPARRSDGRPADAYASELPNLSELTARPGHQGGPRKSVPDRAPDTSTGLGAGRLGSRIEVGRSRRGPVRASMQIRRIDPWSTLKVSLVLSVALFFVWMIAVAFLYLVLGGMGVWSKLNSNVGDLLNNTSGSSNELVSSGTIFGGALLVGLVNIVLLTAMATIGAFVYNLTTDLIGGVEVTLADRD
jgi:hypothetical protein